MGKTRVHDEADPEPLQVLDRIVERLNLKLAAIAGARIYLANAQRAAQDLNNGAPAAPAAHAAGSSGGGGAMTMPT